jgi:hypothetical protein
MYADNIFIMKNICILFNGGSYGTFLEWCLNYFSDLNFNDSLPFNTNGNSHKFHGNQKLNFSGAVNYINSSEDLPVIRFHPKTTKDENLIDNLKFVDKNFRKIVYLIPTKNTMAWNLNNKFEKIWDEGWLKHHEIQFVNCLAGWDKENIEHMETWELREFLSLYLYPQHLAESELEKMQDIQKEFTEFQFITIDSLRDNFKDTIITLLEYCKLTPTRLNKVEEIYQEWISRQYHCYKDIVIKDIIDSVLNNNLYDWSDNKLTLVDEALIQFYLRQHSIEIKCYNLNTFPTNTTILNNYLDYTT